MVVNFPENFTPTETTNTGVLDAFSNWFTGDLDYARELEMLGINQRFNSAEAQANRDWQERISNTAYQRAVADMKSAGLNPYLAYNQGGAYTGGGSSASSSGSHSGKSGKGFDAILSLVGMLVGDAMSMTGKIATEQLKANTALEIAHGRNAAQVYSADARAMAYEYQSGMYDRRTNLWRSH